MRDSSVDFPDCESISVEVFYTDDAKRRSFIGYFAAVTGKGILLFTCFVLSVKGCV